MTDAAAAAAWKAGAIFRRDAKLAISYEAGLFIQWASTISQVVITFLIASMVPASPRFGFHGQSATFFSYAIVNLAFVTFQSTALSSFGRTVREGQMQGTLEAVLATPTNLPLIVLSGGLWAFTFTGLTTVGMLVLALFMGLDLRHTNVPLLCLFLVLTIVALSPLGVLSAAATIVFKQTAPFEFAIGTLSYLFGGVYVPLSLLPQGLQIVGWMLPITHCLNGFRAAIAGARFGDVAGEVAWLAVAIVILVPLALIAFERAVAHAKSDGTLGSY